MSGTQELAARQIREILRVLPKGRSLKDARLRAALMIAMEQLEEQEPIPGVPATNERA